MFIGCLLRRTFELRPCCGSVVVTGLRRSSVYAVGVPKDFFLSMDEVFCADMAFFTPFPWFFAKGTASAGRSAGRGWSLATTLAGAGCGAIRSTGGAATWVWGDLPHSFRLMGWGESPHPGRTG